MTRLACWRVVVEVRDGRVFPIIPAETEDEARRKAVTVIRGAKGVISARPMHDSAAAHTREDGGSYRDRDAWVADSLREPIPELIERRRAS